MPRLIAYLISLLGLGRGPKPPAAPGDPYAWKPVPRKPRPTGRTSAIAVAEPDEEI